MKRKKSEDFLSKFLLSILIILLIVTLFLISFCGIYIYYQTKQLKNQNILDKDQQSEIVYEITNRHLNFMLFGLDESETRTDSIIIGTIDSFDKSIDIVSIYRDTYVELLPENIKKLQDAGYYVPSNGQMKINQIYHYAKEFGAEMLVDQLEYETNTIFDYYATISLDAFKFIIDEIGGVSFYVPQRMYYNDPYQDLFIDLEEGEQILNGEQAEGLIRYRKGSEYSYGYENGDIDRVNVQQDFMKALANQLLQKETITNNLDGILLTVLKYVDTNATIVDIPKIIPYLLVIDYNNINTHTLPVYYETINGESYVKYNSASKEILENIFKDLETTTIEP